MAPSTVGTFLRGFTFDHTRQLDHLTEQTLARAWQAGAGPGDAAMTIDVDATIVEVHGYHKQGASYGYTAPSATARCWPPAPPPARCCWVERVGVGEGGQGGWDRG
jgi:hypothetical protein